MSDEKKTEQTPESEAARQDGEPRAANDTGAKPDEAAHAAQADEPASEAGSLEERVHELEERLKRSVAEQENLRKRMEREKADVAKYAVSNFAREVLGIADNIQRAIEAVPREAAEKDSALKTFLDGIEVTERELHKAMERQGIAKLDPEGEKFDPNFHQAMFEIPTRDMPSGMVAQVVQPGYLLEDRVLRPAMVGVSKAAPAASAANDSAPQPAEAAPAQGANDDAPANERQAGETKAAEDPAGPAGDTNEAKAGDAASESETAGSGSEKSAPQSRGASRLNEPVINGDTEDSYETEPASRKA